MQRKRPIGIDLCCGAGGMSLGFEQAGFDVVAAVDVDQIHVATHSRNFPNCKTLVADLSDLSGDALRSESQLEGCEIDVLFGGPPCGGFSIMGRRKFDDPRNKLLGHFARLVDELSPCYFVVENVEGLLIDPMMDILDEFLEQVDRAGYSTVSPIMTLVATDFGVPQNRRRIFILGYQRGLAPPKYPAVSKNGEEPRQNPTVWDVIGDLPNVDRIKELRNSDVYTGELEPTDSHYAKIMRDEICDPKDLSQAREKNGCGLTGCQQTAHNPETVKRFRATVPGTYEPTSRFYRLTKEGVAPTLRAGSGKSHGSYSAARPIHPIHPRCITVREGARLHSFPDWFVFHKTKWHGFRQVGNSVPPLLARSIASAVIDAPQGTGG